MIWAHIGISRRVEVQDLILIADELLEQNANLWVDISWLDYDYYFLDGFPDNYLDGNTLEDWVTYPAEGIKYYKLLDMLRPETAARVCRENVLSVSRRHYED